MTAVVLAALAGASFGCLAVAVRSGLRHGGDPAIGAFVAVSIAVVISGAAATPTAVRGLDIGRLWPVLVAGLIAPGASQIFLTLAVRHAGPSRAAIFMGMAPLISIAIALTILKEPLHPLLVTGTLLIVAGGMTLARERGRPKQFRLRGAALALLCAALFATRDNLLRWAARGEHPPPLIAATSTLLAADVLALAYLMLTRGHAIRRQLVRAVPAFAPAGLALAVGYDTLLAAFSHGRVSVVSPLNATGSLWAVALSAATIGRSENINRTTLLAAFLVVSGGALIGAVH